MPFAILLGLLLEGFDAEDVDYWRWVLVGGGDDPFGLQLNFIKELDRFMKDMSHHALVLTQFVKDNNNTIIDNDGGISSRITSNSLSGVKQLSHLSRSVMMTAFSEQADRYVYKILKVGSAKYDIR